MTVEFGELTLPEDWHVVECVSDLHLEREHPATLCAFAHYLHSTTADAVFLLGDVFEVWPGDDAIEEKGSFERHCCALLARAARRCALYFMHGNRDFLVGIGFERHCRIPVLDDPTLLVFAGRRWLLSHGDALCVDDVDYQHFRHQVRNPQWQAQLLARSLAERRALAAQMRARSEERKNDATTHYADVDRVAALQWLHAARAQALIHGHTHRAADHRLDESHMRHVLTDWDLDATPPRAEILRLSAAGLQRLPLGGKSRDDTP